jgi:hypothetical protein
MRKSILFVFIFLCSIRIQAQLIQKKNFYFSGALGLYKPSTFSGNYGDYNNHPFMANIKAGKFVSQGLALGIEFQATIYTEPESGVGSLQPPGGTLTQEGVIKDRFFSIGLYSDYYLRVSKNLFLIPGIYFHYLYEKYSDKGAYYSNGEPAGISYNKSRDLGYYARGGVNLSLGYFIKPNLSVTLRIAEFEIRLRRKTHDTFIAAPLMAGVQFYFKPKK